MRRIDVTRAPGVSHDDSLEYDARGKMVHVAAGAGSVTYDYGVTYSGLGAVVFTSRSKMAGYPVTEEMQTDGFGNVPRHRMFTDAVRQYVQDATFEPGSERVTALSHPNFGSDVMEGQPLDSIKTSFDASGNAERYGVHRLVWYSSWTGAPRALHGWAGGDMGSVSYYGADEKLRVYSRSGRPGSRETRSVLEEYRYDAAPGEVGEPARAVCRDGDGA